MLTFTYLNQRGNNRKACFYADEDYQNYLHWLKEFAQKCDCDIHSYVSSMIKYSWGDAYMDVGDRVTPQEYLLILSKRQYSSAQDAVTEERNNDVRIKNDLF